jgi:antitoxin ParD1/3/4
MSKGTEPTERSLREIPEVDFVKAKRLPRGKYAAKARRSLPNGRASSTAKVAVPKLTAPIMKKTKAEQQEAWPGAAKRVKNVAQAKALRKQARKGGLRFEAYLPSPLALWLLGLIEKGEFVDPSEAVFVILGQHRDLEPHADLQSELLKRVVKSALDDPRPSIPAEKVFRNLRKKLAAPRPEPAAWKR